MNLDVETFGLVVAVIVTGMWLASAFARLAAVWSNGERRSRELRAVQQREARKLLRNVQEIQRLNDEIKAAKANASSVADEHASKQKDLDAVVPPPPPSIYVTSEFPSAKRDLAWVIHLRRTVTAKLRDPGGEDHRYHLLWAADHPSALARARQVLANDRGFDVEGARRYP